MKRNLFFLIVSFLFLGTIHAQENHWTPDGVTGDAVVTVWAEVLIDDVLQTSNDIEIAMFFDDACRSATRVSSYYNGQFIGVQCNGQYEGAGKTVTFKCYDHASGTEFDACPYTYTTTGSTETVSYANNPVQLEFTSPTPSGPTYPWVPVETQNNATMTAIVQLNGVTIEDGTDWEVGVFCGDVCRGVGNPENHAWVPIDDPNIPYTNYLFLTIFGEAGEVISFKLYDRASNEVYPGVCDATVTWQANGDWGGFDEPFILNFVVAEQSFPMDIIGYTSGSKDHYYLLASPIGEVSPALVDNMTSNSFDLYYFDQAVEDGLEWINIGNGETNLFPGKGYLYANSQNVTLTFRGMPYSGDGKVTLTKVEDTEFEGWNLVGNPFAQTAYIDRPFYVMKGDGTEIIGAGNVTEIPVMAGIFVIANSNNETMTFSTEAPNRIPSALVLNLTNNRSNDAIDRAIIDFNQGGLLPKFMLNENNTKLSIVQEEKDYAVAHGYNQDVLPVNFKASEDGSYTISVDLENIEMSYLHLIDNMTRADVDLLQTPSYTFEASTTDPDSRFTLEFSKDADHWAPDGVTGNAAITVWAEVLIDDVLQTSNDIEIAMFFNDTCRSTTRVRSYYGGQFTGVQCFGQYEGAGKIVTFKCYDHTTGTEFDACPYTYTTTGETAVVSYANNPVQLEFTSPTPSDPTYPWVPVETQDNATMTALVQLNGVTIEDGTNWELGAFCGNVCRGVGNIENESWVAVDLPDEIPYTYYMNLTINGEAGEEISFKLYDRESEEVYPGVCDLTVTWQANEDWGDLWEPYILNFVTEPTFTKKIIPYGQGNANYYLLATPIGEVSPASVDQMTSNSFDLYYFDQAVEDGLEWINIGNGATNLLPGVGYLYANSGNADCDTVTLTFTGMPYSDTLEIPLVKDDDAELAGWNLVGNPWGVEAYIDRPFYRMNAEGSGINSESETGSIAVMEGVFVLADNNEEVLHFTTEAQTKCASLALNLSQGHGIIDRAIVRFSEGRQLPKFQIGCNSTKLYIPMDNVDYAVVRAEGIGAMPVYFQAGTNGAYTISLSSEEVSFNYLHLIDNMTNVDVDLLTTPSYSFEAKTTDDANRFKLVFATGEPSEDNFAFFNNDSFIINNEGNATLQVVDEMGRIVKSETINGCANVSFNAAEGVYMLRLINGNNVMVQKVVVR